MPKLLIDGMPETLKQKAGKYLAVYLRAKEGSIVDVQIWAAHQATQEGINPALIVVTPLDETENEYLVTIARS